MRLLPAGVAPEARLLLIGRALRAFTDGFVAILLPVYLLAIGFGTWEVGLISTVTLLGSALTTLAVGYWGNRFPQRWLLLAAACLMCLTGLLLAGLGGFWPLLLVAFARLTGNNRIADNEIPESGKGLWSSIRRRPARKGWPVRRSAGKLQRNRATAIEA